MPETREAESLRAQLEKLADSWDARYGPYPNGFCSSLTIHEATGSLRRMLRETREAADGDNELARLRAERDALAAAVDRVRRRHPRGDEEDGFLTPGLWCPTCGKERTDGGFGGCPDRNALTIDTGMRQNA